MKRIFGRTTLNVIIFLLISTSNAAYSQDYDCEGPINSIKGTVADLDWVGNKIVVRTGNLDFGAPDEMTFVVTDRTQIIRGTKAITFAEVNLSGYVCVEYCNASLAGLKAAKITIF